MPDLVNIERESREPRVVSIWLDEYDNIFSDFDSRSYSERTISDDFVMEISKVTGESKHYIQELKLLLPEKIRNKETEAIIARRLYSFFRKNFRQFQQYKRKTLVKGWLLLFTGICVMLIASYIGMNKKDSLLMNLLFVILEPSGWFIVWTSLEDLFYSFRKKTSELEFYSKMIKSKIVFESIT